MAEPSRPDAVVIGAGPNGLVAANVLADAGWSVLVVEPRDSVGGAVSSDRGVHPDYVHDTFSALYPFAAASPVMRGLGLEDHGLVWRHAPAPLGHVREDGAWALVHRDRHDTATALDEEASGDGDAWLRLCETWDRLGGPLLDALLHPFPPVRHGGRLAAVIARHGGLGLVRELLTPAASLGHERFRGSHARLLLTGSAGHADIPLDAPGSGVFGLIMAMLAQTLGFPAPEGGAGALSEALASRLRSRGGEICLGERVERVEVSDGRVRQVVTDRRRLVPRRATVAAVSAPVLYGDLVAERDLPVRVRTGMRSFELDPATVKVDWALDGPVPWSGAPAAAPACVHVADSIAHMQEATSQVASGTVPDRPYLLVGQMTTADPTRSPAGTEALWAYTHLPQGRTDDSDRERLGDLVQARMEASAPGFAERVVSRRVLGPSDLEARNASLVGGAVNGGTSQLHQMLVFRPFPGWGRAETGIGGLYLGSSSAHPGGGVHGAPGANAARAALAHDRLRGGGLRGRLPARS